MKNVKTTLGQYFTSKEIAKFMVSLTAVSSKNSVLEPGCGKGAFIDALIAANFCNITAYEIDPKQYMVCKNKYEKLAKIYNLDFLNSDLNEKFELIIGNPPYVHWNNIDEKTRLFLTTNEFWKKYVNGEWDLLYAFIIWSIEKLKNDGELIFIVPYNWFNSTHAKSLRKYMLQQGYFEILIHFGELKLFSDCFPNNLIIKYKKSSNALKPQIIVCDYNEKKADINELLKNISEYITSGTSNTNNNLKCFKMNNFVEPEMWFLGNQEEASFVDKVENATKIGMKDRYTKMSDFFDICVGMVSGFDKAFIVTKEELDKYTAEEKRHIYRFIKAKDCERYSMNNTSHYIFLDELHDEKELILLPNIYKRLRENKVDLINRYNADKNKWWYWATVRNYGTYQNNLNLGKIFVPNLDRSEKARFSYTEGKYFGSGDVLMVAKKSETKEDIKYALAWLNSSFIAKWYKIKGSKKGQRTQYTQAYVSKIPFRCINWLNAREIEVHNQIVSLSDKLIKKVQEPGLESKIDRLFEELIE